MNQRSTVALTLSASLLLLVTGCDAGGASGSKGGGAEGIDAHGGDATADISVGDAGDSGCVAGVSEAFAVDPDGPLTQIHPAAVRVDDTIWVAYNRPEEGADGFDVYWLALDCSGAVVVPPTRINVIDEINEIEPQIAVSGDRILVAWQSDTPTRRQNLDLMVRLFDREGEPLWAEELVFHPVLDGEQPVVNTWMPAIAAAPDGFVIAGSWAHPAVERFQVFAQRVGFDVQPRGEILAPPVEDDASQVFPSVAVASDGEIALSWTRSADEGDDTAWFATFSGDGEGASPRRIVDSASSGGFVTYDPQDRLWAAASTDGAADVQLIAERSDGIVVELGVGTRRDSGGVLVADEEALHAVWFRNIAGFRNELILQTATIAGREVTLGEETVLAADPPAPPYSPVLVPLPERHLFASWAQGPNPDFLVRGRFLAR